MLNSRQEKERKDKNGGESQDSKKKKNQRLQVIHIEILFWSSQFEMCQHMHACPNEILIGARPVYVRTVMCVCVFKMGCFGIVLCWFRYTEYVILSRVIAITMPLSKYLCQWI